MVPQPDEAQTLTQANEEIYDQLISLIENTQGRLAPIIVACDDEALRKRIIQRYESEAFREGIRSYRIVLGQEPSMRAGLETLKQQEPHLQRGGKAVFTVTGAEMLLRVKLNSQDEQSELDKFFGYLQWTREGLREFRYPIVLWVTHRILLELSRRSADFWSWRKAVLRFETESPSVIQNAVTGSLPSRQIEENLNTELLPPLAELQAEIAELTARDPDAPGLATLYDRLGRVYAQRISQGIAENLEQEREHAIAAFEQAVTLYQTYSNSTAEMKALRRLGNFFDEQSRHPEAITHHQKSLDIARMVNDRDSEARALNNLGNAYKSLGQYQQAIDFYQQSLEIVREIGDRKGEADSLENLGNVYYWLGQYQQELDFYQQSLEIYRKIANRKGEASSLGGLGGAYYSLAQYQQAIDFLQQSLEIYRSIGVNDLKKAYALRSLGYTYHSLGQYQQAIDFLQQSLEIYGEIGGNYWGKAYALKGLGHVHEELGQYQRAVYFYQQSLEIYSEISFRHGKADSLLGIANVLAKLGQPWEALQHYEQAKQIYQSLGLEHDVEDCVTAIYHLNRIIPAQQPTPQRIPPALPDWYIKSLPTPPRSTSQSRRSSQPLWVYGLVGLSIALLIYWLKR